MLVFVRRYEILKSRTIIFATYFAGLFSYTLVLLDLIPIPFSVKAGIAQAGYVYYMTWMSILFAIGVALLYSLIGGFSERGMKSNLVFAAFALLMLLLPTPFTLTIFSKVTDHGSELFAVSSTSALAILIYMVFRHRITMNTPYQAMKASLEAMHDILIKTDANFKIQMVQGAVFSLLGYNGKELTGRSLTGFIRQKSSLETYRETVLKNKVKAGFFDPEMIRKDGNVLPMEFSFTPVYGNEEVTGFVGVGRDISKRKCAELQQDAVYRIAQAAEKAADPEELFKSVHDIISKVMPARSFYIALYDDMNNINFRYFVDELHQDAEPQTPSKQLAEYVLRTGQSLLCNPQLYSKLIDQGKVKHDGTPPLIWWLGVPLMVDKKCIGVMAVQHYSDPAAYGHEEQQMLEYVSSQVARSIERKISEEALRLSEEKYRIFFEEDLTGDLDSTADGAILACNPAFARIFGFPSVGEAMKSNTKLLYSNPKAHASFLKLLRERKKLEYYEEDLQRVDGKPVHVVENVIGTFNPQRELTGIRTYIFDDTERKRLEDQLRQAQKLENLGSLAGGIAHDFNNILAIMSVNASMLKKLDAPEEKRSERIEAIQHAIRRGSGLVGQLLTFARKTDVLFEPVNVNAALQEIVKMLSATFPKMYTFSLNVDTSIPLISADSNQLPQVLMNLCVNARDAMPDGGTVTLSTEVVEGAVLRKRFSEAREQQYICVSVSDTGTGMDEATRNRMFEPFFTTKGNGKGTGLGLAVVYGVLRSHHGFIDVESEISLGTTFRLYFFVPPKDVRSSSTSQPAEEEVARGTETILLIEDEEILLRSISDLLNENGYTVLTARDGMEAVEVYARNKEEIELVLSDVGLPKQSGWDTFLKIREINPAIRFIFASGNLDPNLKAELSKKGVRNFIEKPYVSDEILKSIREVASNSTE
jgi:PAS domain S-box-containing protein